MCSPDARLQGYGAECSRSGSIPQRGDQPSNPFKIGRCVDTRPRRVVANMHRDPVPMPQYPQLFKGFDLLQRSRLQPGEPLQKPGAVSVDSHMPQRCRLTESIGYGH